LCRGATRSPCAQFRGFLPSVAGIRFSVLAPACIKVDANAWPIAHAQPARTAATIRRYAAKRGNMLSTILIIILILILLGAFPAWPYSRSWGYGPSGVVGLILVILLILLLLGKI
jgi:Protein of unknown function (DUF3309)